MDSVQTGETRNVIKIDWKTSWEETNWGTWVQVGR